MVGSPSNKVWTTSACSKMGVVMGVVLVQRQSEAQYLLELECLKAQACRLHFPSFQS